MWVKNEHRDPRGGPRMGNPAAPVHLQIPFLWSCPSHMQCLIFSHFFPLLSAGATPEIELENYKFLIFAQRNLNKRSRKCSLFLQNCKKNNYCPRASIIFQDTHISVVVMPVKAPSTSKSQEISGAVSAPCPG